MASNMLKLIDFEKVNILLEGFNKTTGFVSAILDLEGNVLSQSGWRQICTEFHRVHPETAKRCLDSDTVLAGRMAEGEKYYFYTCLNGLVDVAIPLKINGEHVANLFTGQFFFEKPEREFFVNQAKKYKFDSKIYLDALDVVPVVSKEKVKTAMDFLHDMAQVIAEMTLQKFEQKELNEAFLKSNLLIDSIIDNSPALIYVVDLEGRIQLVNSKFEKLFNLPKEKIIGKLRKDFMPIEIAEQHRNNDLSVISSKKSLTFEEENQEQDGRHYYLTQKFPLFDKNNEVYSVVGISTDVTEKKRAEELLLKEKQFLEAVFNNISEGIVACDAKGILSRFNKAATEFHGISEEPIPATEWAGKYDLFHADGKTPLQKEEIPLFKALNDGTVKDVEMMIVPKNGSPRLTVSNGQRLLDPDENIIGAVVVMHDITERKKIEEELKLREEKYRSLFENITNSFALHKIVLNNEGVPIDYVFVEVNQAFGKQTGVDINEIIGKKVTEIFPGIENDPFDWIGKYGKVALTGKEISFVQYFRQLNKWYNVLAYSSKKNHFATIFTDITEQKHSEEALKRSEELLNETQKISKIGGWEYDVESGETYFSDEIFNIYGISENKIFNPNEGMEYYHPDDRSLVLDSFTKATLEGIPYDIEVRFINAQGKNLWLRTVGKPVIENGKVVKVVGNLMDITESKKSENEIRAQLDELRRWHEVLIDREGRILELKNEVNKLHQELGMAIKYESIQNVSDDSNV